MRSDWLWQGIPGHFCASKHCLFRMNTVVCDRKFIVSTVGDYRPFGPIEQIGCDRLYETMVFKAKPCDCGCEGYIQVDGMEIGFAAANTAKDATANHYRLCEEYDTKEDDSAASE